MGLSVPAIRLRREPDAAGPRRLAGRYGLGDMADRKLPGGRTLGNPAANDGSIVRSDLDGKNITVLVPPGGTFTPKQLQLERKTAKLYWCDREGMRVMRSNLDGSDVETLVQTGATAADRPVSVCPGSAKAHYNLGNVTKELPGRLPDAIVQFRAALQINPGYAQAHGNLGFALATSGGHFEEAIAEYEAALRIDPGLAEAHYNLETSCRNCPAGCRMRSSV